MKNDEVKQLFGKWNKQITRMKDLELDAIIREGNPPEEALRLALYELLIFVAHRVKSSDTKSEYWFPMAFPMRMTLEGDQCLWDFQLKLTLMNDLKIEEEND